eukprot:TRINITY_DN3423_c0_g1_i1.p1 TRINITY_DN3423_c0_g1~~TRINITY_DN3423_c0_g1_i1.p1  ORF type:complete len:417 (+),score=41.85 TRINITY_DN3423_c0_g1_i1:105-1253(+)
MNRIHNKKDMKEESLIGSECAKIGEHVCKEHNEPYVNYCYTCDKAFCVLCVHNEHPMTTLLNVLQSEDLSRKISGLEEISNDIDASLTLISKLAAEGTKAFEGKRQRARYLARQIEEEANMRIDKLKYTEETSADKWMSRLSRSATMCMGLKKEVNKKISLLKMLNEGVEEKFGKNLAKAYSAIKEVKVLDERQRLDVNYLKAVKENIKEAKREIEFQEVIVPQTDLEHIAQKYAEKKKRILKEEELETTKKKLAEMSEELYKIKKENDSLKLKLLGETKPLVGKENWRERLWIVEQERGNVTFFTFDRRKNQGMRVSQKRMHEIDGGQCEDERKFSKRILRGRSQRWKIPKNLYRKQQQASIQLRNYQRKQRTPHISGEGS